MIKQFGFAQFGFALAALICFASQGFARHPFSNDPISDTQSVLVRADESAVSSDAIAPTPMPQPEVGTMVDGSSPAPIATDGITATESAPMTLNQPSTNYRSARPARKSNGIGSELIELERRKNAWLRRTFLGR